MKKALYLILAVLPLTVTPLQAQDINQAKTLVEQAQNALFSNSKRLRLLCFNQLIGGR